MTPDQMRRSLGVLTKGLADIAFAEAATLTPPDAARLLTRAGLLVTHTATAEDAATGFDLTEGQTWLALSAFAIECRRAAGDDT
jgi:hypothetical protein